MEADCPWASRRISILCFKELSMAANKTLINIHTKRYVQEIFEARLREEGFVCPDDKYLCWYRVKNKEVLNSIVFCSSWSQMPLFLDIGYEFAPLFTDPIYIKNVNFNSSTHIRHDCFQRKAILEAGSIEAANLAPFSPDIQVNAPRHAGRGIYTFNEVLLPMFEQAVSVRDCYSIHKQYHLDMNARYGDTLFKVASREFIDEAVYLDDTEVYPYCRARIERALKMYKHLVEKKPDNQQLQDILKHWEQLHAALFDGAREEYLGILEMRKKKITAKLRKKFGLEI